MIVERRVRVQENKGFLKKMIGAFYFGLIWEILN